MLSFDNAAAIAAAPTNASIDPVLKQLLADRVHDWTATDLLEQTHLLIIEPGDTESEIIQEIGLSPLVNPIDGARFGSSEFHPPWDFLDRCDGFFEMIVCVGNAGFSFVILIPDAAGVHPELLSLCRAYLHAEEI